MSSADSNKVIENSQTRFAVDDEKLADIAQNICDFLRVGSFELGVKLTTPENIKDLNKTYRGKDKETDVLSFPQMEWDAPLLCVSEKMSEEEPFNEGPPATLGDLVLCIEVASQNAQLIGQGLDKEVCFLMVHGILHLCGHDHLETEEEKVMLEQQNMIMKNLSSLSSEPMWTNCVKDSGENQ